MRGWLCLFLLFLLPSGAALAQLSIARPNFGVPEFAETNGTFRVELQAVAGLGSSQWTAILANDLRAWTGTVEQADYGAYVENNTVTGYQLRVRLAADTPPEVFDLTVSHPGGGTDTNRHCVSVLRCFETNFYILHYADPQVETDNASAANGAGGSHGSVQAMNWAAPVYSLINPRFMFNTGDEVENGVAGFYPKYLAAAGAIGAPLLITRGNNDAQGSYSDWKRDIGQSTYSITLGSFYVCMKDYNNSDYTTWLTNDYASSFANSNIAFRLIGQHYNSGTAPFLPSAGEYPDLMLVGHNHSFSTLSSIPYYVLSSGPGWDYGAVAIFEFTKSGSSWICSNKTAHGSSDKLQVYGDWGVPPRVTNTYAHANDGSQTTNAAAITNNLSYRFWDGRVRFLLGRVNLGYTVSGGEKLAEYDYTPTNSAVLVKVNIAPSSLTTVSVFRVDTDDDTMPDDWERARFGNLTTATSTSDYDQDGLLDWQEYVAGTEPTNAGSVLRITDLRGDVLSGGYLLRWTSAADRVYGVLWATSLFNSFATLASNLPASPPENVHTDSTHQAEPAFFYRITVGQP